MNRQTKLVADYLTRHGRLTPLVALKKLGVMRLGARVWELRHEHGMSISRVMKRVRTRDGSTRVAEYRIA